MRRYKYQTIQEVGRDDLELVVQALAGGEEQIAVQLFNVVMSNVRDTPKMYEVFHLGLHVRKEADKLIQTRLESKYGQGA